MGAFFLYRNLDASSLSRVRQVFKSRGFGPPEIEIWEDYALWRYPKLAGFMVPPVRGANGDRLFVSGSLNYRGLVGESGAGRLLLDLRSGTVDHDEMIGGFLAVYLEAGSRSPYFITDRWGLYHIFTNGDGTFLSSSFLAAAAAVSPQTQIDSDAVLENLCLGFVMAPRTLLRGVQRVGGDSWQGVRHQLGRFIRPTEMKVEIARFEGALDCASRQVSVLRETVAKLVGVPSGPSVAMGLSGGYDSRLLLLLVRDAGAPIITHTHFKPAPDPDPVLAHRVAEAAGVPLIMPRTPLAEEMDEGELAGTVKRAMLFFDGRTHSQMGLLRKEYTPWYRREVYRDAETVLGGVGGEIYRNYDGSSGGTMRGDVWVGYYLVGYPVLSALQDDETRRLLLQTIRAKVANRLRENPLSRVCQLSRRRFYEEIWLADWHGLRNSVENQFSYYFSPFAHPPIMAAARSALAFLGAGGEFEASMIRHLDPEIAKLASSYGYGFDRIPFGEQLKLRVWAKIPAGLKLSAGLIRAGRRKGGGKELHRWETHYGFIGRALNNLRGMGLPLNLEQYANNRTRLMLLLSVAFTVTALDRGPDPSGW